MTIKETANQFAEYCKNEQDDKVMQMYSDDIVSIEAMEGDHQVCKGKEQLQQKLESWIAMNEIIKSNCQGPYINGDQFSLYFSMTVKDKNTQEITDFQEVALYTVKDGKIVEEKFMY